jgi:hypothetical protein
MNERRKDIIESESAMTDRQTFTTQNMQSKITTKTRLPAYHPPATESVYRLLSCRAAASGEGAASTAASVSTRETSAKGGRREAQTALRERGSTT